MSATSIPEAPLPRVTPKALAALRVLASATTFAPMSAKSVARCLWAQRLKECGTSQRRGGLYRAAGAYCSRLQKQVLVGYSFDDFQHGYYLTDIGRSVVSAAGNEDTSETDPTRSG